MRDTCCRSWTMQNWSYLMEIAEHYLEFWLESLRIMLMQVMPCAANCAMFGSFWNDHQWSQQLQTWRKWNSWRSTRNWSLWRSGSDAVKMWSGCQGEFVRIYWSSIHYIHLYSQMSYSFILHLILGIFRRQSSNMFVQPYVLQIRKLLKDCCGIWALPGWALTSLQLVGWCWSRLSPRDRLTDLHGAILEPVLYWGPVKFPGRLVRKTWHFVSYLLQISKLWPHGVLSLKMVYRRVKQLGLRLSSGSTGVPKCIQIAHGGATACCRFQSIELNL